MSKNIYIGVDDKARRISKAYLGVNNIAKTITKGYIGVNGVAQQFYPGLNIKYFSVSPYPSWSSGTSEATGTNQYGTWTIYGLADGSGYYIRDGFDGDTSSHFAFRDMVSGTTRTTYVQLPSGVYIKPDQIRVSMARMGSPVKLTGITESGSSVTISSSVFSSSSKNQLTQTVTYSGSYYFSQFSLTFPRYTSSYDRPWLYDFSILSGYIKIV